jgi:hypothetical protein
MVACGYRDLATRYRDGRRVSARMQHDGRSWMLSVPAPDQMWKLSRLAKRHFMQIADLMEREPFADFISSSSSGPPSSPVPTPPSPRPVLRLV